MAHQLEMINGHASFVSSENIKAWHGLGVKLPGTSFTIAQAKENPIGKRCFFETKTERTFLADGREAMSQALLRADNNELLASVGMRWTPLQTEDALVGGISPFLANLPSQEITLQTLGVLNDGRTVFGQTPPILEMPIGKGDKRWTARVTVANHNYARRCEIILTTTDVVCANTLGAASAMARFDSDDEEQTGARVRHTRDVSAVFAAAAKRMSKRIQDLHKMAEGASVALETPLTREQETEIVASLFSSKNKEGKESPQSQAVQARVLQLSLGNGLVGAAEHNPGSYYGLYAAITQYLDREMPRRFSVEEDSDANLASAGTYFRSALGLDPRIQEIRSEATRVLLGTGV